MKPSEAFQGYLLTHPLEEEPTIRVRLSGNLPGTEYFEVGLQNHLYNKWHREKSPIGRLTCEVIRDQDSRGDFPHYFFQIGPLKVELRDFMEVELID